MNTHLPSNQSHLFIVRVWLEEPGEGKTEWRGQVKHVMSDEVHYFHDWQTLVEHLKATLASMEEAKEKTPERKGD